jgi:hypothetical protein
MECVPSLTSPEVLGRLNRGKRNSGTVSGQSARETQSARMHDYATINSGLLSAATSHAPELVKNRDTFNLGCGK